MRKYKVIAANLWEEISYSISATLEDGAVLSIPFDETNSDYQQYLIDTDGGLPLPEEQA